MLIMSLSHNSDIYVKIVEKQIVVLFYQIVFFKPTDYLFVPTLFIPNFSKNSFNFRWTQICLQKDKFICGLQYLFCDSKSLNFAKSEI